MTDALTGAEAGAEAGTETRAGAGTEAGAGAASPGWVPDDAEVEALHRRYAPSEQVLELVLTHGRVVADVAAGCADRLDARGDEAVDRALLRATCLLHDLGTYALYSPDGRLGNHAAYPLHALIGATLLREEGVDERVAAAVRTHVLMGLSAEDIRAAGFLLPQKDFRPQGLVAQLLCYADRFHSKRPCLNDPKRFAAGLEASLPRQAELFREAQQRFGLPDLAELARRYGHPVV